MGAASINLEVYLILEEQFNRESYIEIFRSYTVAVGGVLFSFWDKSSIAPVF